MCVWLDDLEVEGDECGGYICGLQVSAELDAVEKPASIGKLLLSALWAEELEVWGTSFNKLGVDKEGLLKREEISSLTPSLP